MNVKLKCGDKYIEVDSHFSKDKIDSLEKIKDELLEDTKELNLNFGGYEDEFRDEKK